MLTAAPAIPWPTSARSSTTVSSAPPLSSRCGWSRKAPCRSCTPATRPGTSRKTAARWSSCRLSTRAPGLPAPKKTSSPPRGGFLIPAAPAKPVTASAGRWASGGRPARWAKSSTKCSRWAPAWTRSPTSGNFCTSTSCRSRSWIWKRCRATGWSWKTSTPFWPRPRPVPPRWNRSWRMAGKLLPKKRMPLSTGARPCWPVLLPTAGNRTCGRAIWTPDTASWRL